VYIRTYAKTACSTRGIKKVDGASRRRLLCHMGSLRFVAMWNIPKNIIQNHAWLMRSALGLI